MKFKFPAYLSFLVSFLTLLFLLGTSSRLLFTPVFLQIEYNMPYFPRDEYGLTKEERLHWAPYTMKYLMSNEDISYLAGLQYEDGLPLYNGRELRHLADVKLVTQGAFMIWRGSIVMLVLLGVWAWFGEGKQAYRQGLKRGGWWMIGFASALGVIVGVSLLSGDLEMFLQFFSLFHQLFFKGGSWEFYYSDTLIRLFPPRFWEDAFLWAATLALGGGIGLAFGLKQASPSEQSV